MRAERKNGFCVGLIQEAVMSDFETLRKEYPEFLYESYSVERAEHEIILKFRFSLGETVFTPVTRIKTDNLRLVNAFDCAAAKRIVFYLGMVEAVSYWKAACAPKVRVLCGALSDKESEWFKKLWFSGLGEFFYRNGINTDYEDFVEIVSQGSSESISGGFNCSEINIIPVGGGKDSVVTTELMSGFADKNMFFTVNDQPAREECVSAAGYDLSRIIRTYRTIDQNLLELNRRGFLNGHTPFSAIVAFLSYYCAYITGAKNIILSNEASANEANVGGTQVNHQYSKSYEFEKDFSELMRGEFGADIRYFSLLRPFSEVQIAKMFASYPQYLSVFKSCNAGSKKNIWCGKCAKCLFVFIMLLPFADRAALEAAFGCNMLDKKELSEDFNGLCGFSGVKPFECVGTAREVRAALELALKKYGGEPLPVLLEEYKQRRTPVSDEEISLIFSEFNEINGIPAEFDSAVRGMHKYVSAND